MKGSIMTTTSTEQATTPEQTDAETQVFEKGTWQYDLNQSSTLLDRSTKARKRASHLLWTGAKAGIEEWTPNAATDVSAEGLYAEILSALGTSRKGDASKIKTVALAVRNHSLDLATFDNLSKAYAEATRLTKTVAQHAEEDDAAEKAVESIEAPKTTSSIDGAALLLLSKGIDGAIVAILDALGHDNEAAHRSFMRALSTEIAARVQAKKPAPAPKASAPKAGATQAKATQAKAPAQVVTKGKPKGNPVGQATKPTAEVVTDADKGAPVDAPVEAGVETVESEQPAQNQVSTPRVAKKAVRRPVQRA